ncbi:MAG: hypothetical protein CMJ78_23625 [Planctomycetaceae bacterium]|nr:hypothetical protein [Planctomycetaceae bacterium]
MVYAFVAERRKPPGFSQMRLLTTIFFIAAILAMRGPMLCANEQPSQVASVINATCVECHNDEVKEGGLNLKSLAWKLSDKKIRQRWTQIHDRVAKSEMPPDKSDLASKDRKTLLEGLSKPLHAADLADVTANGRGPMRRLTRLEYEQNLRDVLKLPHLDIRDILPADREKHHSNRVAEVLDISRVQMAAYLNAADVALRRAVASGMAPRSARKERLLATRMFQSAATFGGREAMFYTKDSKMILPNLGDLRSKKNHDPKVELAIFRSASWPYYGYPDAFRANQPGAYHIRFSARAIRQVRDFRTRAAFKSLAMTFRARKPSGPDVTGDVRATGGWIDVQPEVGVYETTIRLKKGETFEYSLLGLPVPRPITINNGPLYYDFPPMPAGGHPGIAYQWLEITGPIDSKQWPPPSHKVLFGDTPIQKATKGDLAVELASENPRSDAIRLLRRFVKLAERQPTSETAIKVYEQLVLAQLDGGEPLTEALIAGYSAFLCSGDFLYLHEPSHSSFAVASRLSHMISNSRPDHKLLASAANGKLVEAAVLQQETDRLIDNESFNRFIDDFADNWLSLKDIRRDAPDIRLYPEYRFDEYLIDSMDAETRTFVKALFRNNLPITNLIDADFVYINERLARHYDLKPINGSKVRKVKLPESSPLGGLLTQAAILKVTANGTSTSPVIRGAWITDRILGDPPPPPPASVPAVEPDIRGAKTIREQLARHTKNAACAKCHVRFDPVGFALESFDIMGAWRDRYRSLGSGEEITGIDRAGHKYSYRVAGNIDTSGRLLDGREFKDITELKALLIAEPRKLARNLLSQLALYATGTPVRFSDRQELERILDKHADNGYRTRDLLHSLIQSRIFVGIE